MKDKFVFATLLTIACLTASSVAAQTAEPESLPKPPEITVPAPQGPMPPQDGRSADPENAWRFKWHHGLWWYWLPGERWVYWLEGRWVDYDPQTFQQQMAERARRHGHWLGPPYYSNAWVGGRVGVYVAPHGVRVKAYGVRVGVDY